MKQVVLIDSNLLVRFITKEHPVLSPRAKTIFAKAENGEYQIYLDEIVLAEAVWVLTSVYKQKRLEISTQLIEIVSSSWITNPLKDKMLEAIFLYKTTNLSYIDCWIYVVSKSKNFKLETFDIALSKFAEKN